jgi:hypothetical protein
MDLYNQFDLCERILVIRGMSSLIFLHLVSIYLLLCTIVPLSALVPLGTTRHYTWPLVPC